MTKNGLTNVPDFEKSNRIIAFHQMSFFDVDYKDILQETFMASPATICPLVVWRVTMQVLPDMLLINTFFLRLFQWRILFKKKQNTVKITNKS